MSKLNGSLYSSDDHTWETPPDIINRILAFEGRNYFDIDAACTRFDVPAYRWLRADGAWAETSYGISRINEDVCGLTANWEGLVWLNPPYGTDLKRLWMPKVAAEAAKGVKIWALLPARTETQYQHQYGLTKAGFTVFIYERLCFWRDGKPYLDPKTGKPGTAPFPTMLLYFGDDYKEKAQRWLQEQPIKGTLMMPLEQTA